AAKASSAAGKAVREGRVSQAGPEDPGARAVRDLAAGRVAARAIKAAKASGRMAAVTAPVRDHSEPLSYFHPTAPRNNPVEGGTFAGGNRRLSAVASVGASASGLSDHPGADVLSRSGPARDRVFRDGAAGTPVWAGAGPQTDDLYQHVWRLAHHSAI